MNYYVMKLTSVIAADEVLWAMTFALCVAAIAFFIYATKWIIRETYFHLIKPLLKR